MKFYRQLAHSVSISTFSYDSSPQLLSPIFHFSIQWHNCGTSGLPHCLTYIRLLKMNRPSWLRSGVPQRWKCSSSWQGEGWLLSFLPRAWQGSPAVLLPGLSPTSSPAPLLEPLGALEKQQMKRDGTCCTSGKDLWWWGGRIAEGQGGEASENRAFCFEQRCMEILWCELGIAPSVTWTFLCRE